MRGALILAIGTLACSTEATVPSSATGLDEWTADSFFLEEPVGRVIGRVGAVVERPGSRDLLVSDVLNRSIRLHGDDGAYLGSMGSGGRGPGEFERISSMAFADDGGIAVADARIGRISYFDRQLQFDTAIRRSAFELVALTGDTILIGSSLSPHLQAWSRTNGFLWGAFSTPVQTRTNPYWNGISGPRIAAIRDSVFVMHGLLYPMTVYHRQTGDSLGVFGQPSDSYREITVVPAGSFAGSKQMGPEIQQWLNSFDIVERLDVVGSYLVVTHATARRAREGFEMDHTVIDIYDWGRRGEKVWENVALPEGARVVGGGSYLYVLMSEVPPWRVSRVMIPAA